MQTVSGSESESPKFWLKFALGAGLLVLAGGFLYFRVGKKHGDYELVKQLSRKIELAFEQAEGSLMPLVPDKTKLIRDDKISMTLNLAQNLSHKDKVAQLSTKNPFEPPFEKGLLISELPPGHWLLYNKFYFLRNHLLVVTQRYESQTVQLSKQDFKQTVLTMYALRGCFFFNCGPESGFSQKHKHVQLLPSDALDYPIMKQLVSASKNNKSPHFEQVLHRDKKIHLFKGYQFVHGVVLIESTPDLDEMAAKFHQAYKTLHNHLTTLLKRKDISYNLIGYNNFLIMIPRKCEKILGQVGVNAVGFMGSILLKDEKLFEQLQYLLKPSDILRELTYTGFI